MKHFVFISCLFLSVSLHVFSQSQNMMNPYWLNETAKDGADLGIFKGINESPLFKTDWSKGYILFSDNSFIKNVLLSFNIYTNEVYFFKNHQALILNTPKPAIQFGLASDEDSNNFVVFRCGFPPVESFTSQTFYNVLAVGKIVLLKHYNKSIVERKSSLSIPENFFSNSETWYLFNSSIEKMIQVKKNKDSFLKALPEYNQQIQTIIENKKLKLKKEPDFIVLVNALNDEIK